MSKQIEIEQLSSVVLAGGRSQRMGTDKAFLRYGGRTFLSLIVGQLLRISDDVIVAIGKKDRSVFESEVSDRRVFFINDEPYLDNPLGGMLSALGDAEHNYAFVTACDSPFPNLNVVRYLYDCAKSHSAAVPVWEESNVMTSEPLVAVYNVTEAKRAILDEIRRNLMSCRHMLSLLPDVRYVSVSNLRNLDPTLTSLLNLNKLEDYHGLEG